MAPDPSPGRPPLSPSEQKTSSPPPDAHSPQLSAPNRVNSPVSSVAMDRGLYAVVAAMPETVSELRPPLSYSDEFSDAEVMLRVKAGDESAFAYLVQKYRRAMVSFMYRM